MSLTDSSTPEGIFANLLVPLKRMNARRGVHYFASKPDQGAASYWQPVSTRSGGVEQLPQEVSDGAALIDLLARHWAATGDAVLVKMAPQLKALYATLAADDAPAREEEAEVSDFVYPLF